MRKKVGIIAFIAAVTFTSVFGLVPVGNAVSSDNTAVITVSAAAKKGFVKTNGSWYYYKNGKKVTGLQKIGKKYYFFDKKGVMKSGKKTVSGFTYYFNKAKDGKAPALMSKSKKLSGKSWYFSSKGRGFYSVGDTTGDKAVAKLWDKLEEDAFDGISSDEDRLRVVFDAVLENMTYAGYIKTKHDDTNWQFDDALTAISGGKGKCFHYASLTGLAVKALGIKSDIIVGEGTRVDRASEHAWGLVNDKYVIDTVYNDDDGKGKVEKYVYFYKTYDELKENPGTTYKEVNRY